ncbi:hypothetical protein PIB30_033925 [Stylosanthes scabra]|uniref:Uncharacterized protein n=1 Tax=Stylosanthes scabra TaxID=79078 RepID=A0ABU6XE18_9FABA|nr:hypothetical protein [Stylosanthes scabra]
MVGLRKVVMTFDTVENMEVVVRSQFMLNNFTERIREVWGTVIEVHEGDDHYNLCKMLVDTNCSPTIQAILNVEVNGVKVGIFVKEVGDMSRYPEVDNAEHRGEAGSTKKGMRDNVE